MLSADRRATAASHFVSPGSARLTDLGIEHVVAQATVGCIIVFHDPDGTESHLYSRKPGEVDMAGTPRRGRVLAVSG